MRTPEELIQDQQRLVRGESGPVDLLVALSGGDVDCVQSDDENPLQALEIMIAEGGRPFGWGVCTTRTWDGRSSEISYATYVFKELVNEPWVRESAKRWDQRIQEQFRKRGIRTYDAMVKH